MPPPQRAYLVLADKACPSTDCFGTVAQGHNLPLEYIGLIRLSQYQRLPDYMQSFHSPNHIEIGDGG
jgi:hypothetical protein